MTLGKAITVASGFTEYARRGKVEIQRGSEILQFDMDRIYDGKIRFEPGMLSTVGTRQILARMLANLKAIYFNNEEYDKALSAVEHLLILHPHEASEIRDRGLLACQLRRYAEAMSDLERYLRLAPEANDSATIREHLCALRKRAAALN